MRYKRSRIGREDKSGAGGAKIWMRGTYLRDNNKKSLGDNDSVGKVLDTKLEDLYSRRERGSVNCLLTSNICM